MKNVTDWIVKKRVVLSAAMVASLSAIMALSFFLAFILPSSIF